MIILVATMAACAGEGATTTSEAPPPTTAGPSTTDITPTTEPAPTTEPPPTTEAPIDGPTAEIVISGFSFGSRQTIAVGTTVIATNQDPFTHTWTSADDIWDSGNLGMGETFAHTFDEAGTFSFFCKIHATEMGGSIVVEG
jgi:plastocyanin